MDTHTNNVYKDRHMHVYMCVHTHAHIQVYTPAHICRLGATGIQWGDVGTAYLCGGGQCLLVFRTGLQSVLRTTSMCVMSHRWKDNFENTKCFSTIQT